jgi:hypothetical protein
MRKMTENNPNAPPTIERLVFMIRPNAIGDTKPVYGSLYHSWWPQVPEVSLFSSDRFFENLPSQQQQVTKAP